MIFFHHELKVSFCITESLESIPKAMVVNTNKAVFTGFISFKNY